MNKAKLKERCTKKQVISVLFSFIFGITVHINYAQNKENSAFIENLGKPKIDGGLKREGYSIWGSSVIKDSLGVYHMFTGCWSNKQKNSSWVTASTILHSISDTPEGPFKVLGDAITPRGEGYWDGSSIFNPVIQKYKDTFIIFYTGTYFVDTGSFKGNNYQALSNKRIGIATSKSLYGPWKRYEQPILIPRKNKWDAIITSNPAPFIEEDGSVLLVYKSWTRHATDYYANKKPGEINQLLGVARADHYLGEYKRLSNNHIFNDVSIPFNSEDPFIWKQDGKYHMLAKIFEVGEQLIGEAGGGFYATSTDGIDWKINENGSAWSRAINWKNGTTTNFNRVERPQLLFKNGKPTHIYFACRSNEAGVESQAICIPLKK